MADFSNIAANKRTGEELLRLPLNTSIGEIVLIGRIAGEANKPYYSALLLKAGASARRLRSNANRLTPEMIAQNRQQDIDLFPKFVLTGWEGPDGSVGPVDASGEPVAYTEDACRAFLSALDDTDVDFIRNEFATVTNFLPDVDVDTVAEK